MGAATANFNEQQRHMFQHAAHAALESPETLPASHYQAYQQQQAFQQAAEQREKQLEEQRQRDARAMAELQQQQAAQQAAEQRQRELEEQRQRDNAMIMMELQK